MKKQTAKLPVLKEVASQEITPPTQEEVQAMMSKIHYKPQGLVWHNFHAQQPLPDRWILIWCAFGKLTQNLYVVHRNALGHYDLPHPTKNFPLQAWAYIDNPEAIPPEESEKVSS